MRKQNTSPASERRYFLMAATASGVAALIAGCAVPSGAPVLPARSPVPSPDRTSSATTPRAYRRDAASHLYSRNSGRIFKGVMPALLYAIGVLEVEIDRSGYVSSIYWMRAPTHAPEVIAEIERMVRQAAPYPAPARMGRVTYTDTWLWDKSGLFQLDTLTEGQQ